MDLLGQDSSYMIGSYTHTQKTPYKTNIDTVVVCTDLSGKEPHIHIGMSRSLCGVMVSTLARNARDVGSIPALGTTFPTT